MTGLQAQLTAALERLSEEYETERQRQSEQAEVFHEQVEWPSGQVRRFTEGSGTFGVRYRGGG